MVRTFKLSFVSGFRLSLKEPTVISQHCRVPPSLVSLLDREDVLVESLSLFIAYSYEKTLDAGEENGFLRTSYIPSLHTLSKVLK